MNDPIILRRGEPFRPEEFPPADMDALNRRLDAIRDERYPLSEWVERVLSHRVSVTVLTLVGAALIGWAAFHTAVTP